MTSKMIDATGTQTSMAKPSNALVPGAYASYYCASEKDRHHEKQQGDDHYQTQNPKDPDTNAARRSRLPTERSELPRERVNQYRPIPARWSRSEHFTTAIAKLSPMRAFGPNSTWRAATSTSPETGLSM